MNSVTEAASAKINLFLHVGERRADGFHPLQSLVVFTGAGDRLTAEKADTLSLAVTGPFAATLQNEADNLVLRAARALATRTGIAAGAALRLEKSLPVASGIGGGSADAAAALRALKTLWGAAITDAALLEIAAELGSDIPVCMASAATFMEGRGEVLTPIISLPRLSMLLVNPGAGVSTRDVFAGLQTRRGVGMALPQGRFTGSADLLRFLETTTNDMEASALIIQPLIGEVLTALAALPGALLARMSGSGATCFAIFPDDDSCNRAAAALRAAAPGWWVMPTFVPEQGLEHEAIGQDFGPNEGGI